MAEKNALKLARMPLLKTNNGLYGASSETQGQSVGSRKKPRRKALPERGTFFGIQIYERVGRPRFPAWLKYIKGTEISHCDP